jgi:hypothetical protein
LPSSLEPAHREDGVDALLLGGADEAAGVDHHVVGVFGLDGEVTPRGLGHAEHHLGVDAILGAAQGDEVDTLRGGVGGGGGGGS